MSTLIQSAVPVNAARLAKQGDGRALLAIPDARLDLPRLLGIKVTEYCRYSATDLGNRKAIKAAKEIMAERLARREARKVAEAARIGVAGRIAADLNRNRQATISGVVGSLLNANYRNATSSWAGGETENLVTLNDCPFAAADTTKVWSRNGKWSGQNLRHRVQVSPRWLDQIQGRGLGVVDGLVTTHAESMDAPDGFEAFRATWVRQGRGMEIRTESGCIARHVASGTTYHSTKMLSAPADPAVDGYRGTKLVPDVKAAISGLRRKLTTQAIPTDVRAERRNAAQQGRLERQASQLARLVERVMAWDMAEIQHVTVSRRDSLKTGNCVPGTDDFISRYFPERDGDAEPSATIGEIAARIGRIDPGSLKGKDLTFARQLAAACLQGIRRDRQARRLVMA